MKRHKVKTSFPPQRRPPAVCQSPHSQPILLVFSGEGKNRYLVKLERVCLVCSEATRHKAYLTRVAFFRLASAWFPVPLNASLLPAGDAGSRREMVGPFSLSTFPQEVPPVPIRLLTTHPPTSRPLRVPHPPRAHRACKCPRTSHHLTRADGVEVDPEVTPGWPQAKSSPGEFFLPEEGVDSEEGGGGGGRAFRSDFKMGKLPLKMRFLSFFCNVDRSSPLTLDSCMMEPAGLSRPLSHPVGPCGGHGKGPSKDVYILIPRTLNVGLHGKRGLRLLIS